MYKDAGAGQASYMRQIAMIQALTFEIRRSPFSYEDPPEAELLLTHLAEYHCDHNGYHHVTASEMHQLVTKALDYPHTPIQEHVDNYVYGEEEI